MLRPSINIALRIGLTHFQRNALSLKKEHPQFLASKPIAQRRTPHQYATSATRRYHRTDAIKKEEREIGETARDRNQRIRTLRRPRMLDKAARQNWYTLRLRLLVGRRAGNNSTDRRTGDGARHNVGCILHEPRGHSCSTPCFWRKSASATQRPSETRRHSENLIFLFPQSISGWHKKLIWSKSGLVEWKLQRIDES